jgi:type IV secretion system protein VirB5
MTWRFAALGSISLCGLLGLAFAISAGRATVTPHLVDVAPLDGARAVNPAMGINAPPDAQIAFFLARFVQNVRSLSVDPVVVRTRWMDALNYVTARGAHTLYDYARDADPSTKIGMRSIIVEVIYVGRASANSFEMRWKEQTYENGDVMKTDRFTGVANLVFRSPNTTETISQNPLGLYVNAFNWSRDSIGVDTR